MARLGILGSAAAALCRHYPLYSGNTRFAHAAPLRWLRPAGDTAVARLTNGLSLEVFPADYIGSVILFFGDYDPKISWICRRVLRPGDAVLDIGAHHGVISVFAADRVGPQGVVHAFEPQPRLARTLRNSIALNALTNLHLHEVALSDADGVMTLHVPESNSSGASLSDNVKGATTDVQVQVRSAADYLRNLNCPPLRLVKLDVEGHEETVLRSAEPFLSENRPAVITFESHHDGLPFWERGAVKVMRRLGYGFYSVPKAMFRMKLHRLAEGVEPSHHGYDFVAVAPGPQKSELLRALAVE